MSAEQPNFFGWPPLTPESRGRHLTFETPRHVWEAACEYFTWVKANPILTLEKASSDGMAHTIEIPKARPMTIGGLCVFLGMSPQTWANYRDRAEFLEVISAIEQVMRAQKFEGAAVGLFNANIISRDLGLADKHQLGGDPDNKTPVPLTMIELVAVEPGNVEPAG